MKFWKKLIYYSIGVILGTFLVSFIFSDRELECSYFPNDRVLYDLRKKDLSFSEQAQLSKLNLDLDSVDIQNIFLSGKVEFARTENETDQECKTYWISRAAKDAQAFEILIENCDSTATILELNSLLTE